MGPIHLRGSLGRRREGGCVCAHARVCVVCVVKGGEIQLQTTVNSLDGLSFLLGDDALLDVVLHLLVHEVLQLGQVVVWGGQTQPHTHAEF